MASLQAARSLATQGIAGFSHPRVQRLSPQMLVLPRGMSRVDTINRRVTSTTQKTHLSSAFYGPKLQRGETKALVTKKAASVQINASSFVDEIKKFFASIIDFIKGVFSAIIRAIKGVLGIKNTSDKAEDAKDAVVSAIDDAAASVQSAISDAKAPESAT